MNIFFRWVAMATATLILPLFAAEPAPAAVTVFGNGLAQVCSAAAKLASRNLTTEAKALQACDMALTDESLTLHDRAGTFINRGVLLLAKGSVADAKRDFDAAVALMPELGEAYTDRGAALISLRRYSDAIADIDRGLSLKAEEPEKAYFNRALADEALDDLKSAYFDYKQAADLKPGWEQPRIELTRFTVGAQ